MRELSFERKEILKVVCHFLRRKSNISTRHFGDEDYIDESTSLSELGTMDKAVLAARLELYYDFKFQSYILKGRLNTVRDVVNEVELALTNSVASEKFYLEEDFTRIDW